jgi:hypothetical protein
MYRLYDYLPSGNGYKVRLVLKQLALPYELIELDIRTGATRTADFLGKNPNGRIPLLEVRRVTRSLRISPTARASFPPIRTSARACGNGCASSNTTSSRTSRRCVSG